MISLILEMVLDYWVLLILLADLNIINKIKKNEKNLKKNLTSIKEKNPHKTILYFDESRFGTKTKTGLGWFIKGIIPFPIFN